jgi:hypothetical protein
MKKLIIAEGQDDKKFFLGLLDYLKILDVEVVAIKEKGRGSKTDILNVNSIQLDIASKIGEKQAKILITCDADFKEQKGNFDGFKKTQEALSRLIIDLKNNEFNSNKEFDFFTIPTNEIDRNLESLFLDCMAIDKKTLGCLENYFSCLSKKFSFKNNNPKTKVFSLLAPIGSNDEVYKAGYAAYDEKTKKYREGYWNFESESLNKIKETLEKFFNLKI